MHGWLPILIMIGLGTGFAVVNIGRPAEGAWMDRLPRLDYDEVVTSV